MQNRLQESQKYRTRVENAANAIQSKLPTGAKPSVGLILGSGLGALVHELQDTVEISYDELPDFPQSTAPGHSGTLHYGKLGDKEVLAWEGRFHIYEGYSLSEITLPVRVMARLGVGTLFVSNAAGGLSKDFQKGDLMIIGDQINLMGDNPLIGPNHDDWGPRFPDMCRPYDPELRQQMLAIAKEENIRAQEGVYAAMPGPCLETSAEYKMLSIIGAQAIGMSTVPEVIVAVHEGLRVAGISVITDLCIAGELEPVSVEEILQVAAEAEPKLTKVASKLIRGL